MVRQFKLGGVYKCEVGMKDEELGVSFLIKVVGLDRARRVCNHDEMQYRIFGKSKRSLDELIGGTPACVRTKNIEAPPFSEIDIESFFVSERSSEIDLDAEVVGLNFREADNYGIISSSERVILKTGVLLFCATKLIVIARRVKERVKERMYDLILDLGLDLDVDLDLAVDRAAKSQRIE
jgi:hypothetical protein